MKCTHYLLLVYLFTIFITPIIALSDGPMTPEEAINVFRIEPGLRIEFVAAEPDVIDPVAMAFDEDGRLFVMEMRDYPDVAEGKPAEGRIALLEDSDGDGRFKRRSEFAIGLAFANGLMPYQGGLIVTCAPDLLFLKDTDGDGKADVRKVLFTGFALGGSTQLRVNHPTLGIDNWIYLANGLSGGSIKNPDQPEKPALDIARCDFRFRPGGEIFEAVGGQAQFGLTFDDFGRRFVCSNRNHLQHVVLDPVYLRRNPYFAFSDGLEDIPDHGAACTLYPISTNTTTAVSHAGTFTAACGVTVYRGRALPAAYRGNVFVCDPTANLVHRDVLSPAGATFTARRATEKNEFLASPDNWCRPVNLANGPDGALYVCDMYRKTIEHPLYLPEQIRKITDFESGQLHGRIYRITAENDSRGEMPHLSDAKTSQLVELLKHPEGWWRDTAQRLLLERQDKSAIAALRALLQESELAVVRVHALRGLDALNALEEHDLKHALSDPHAAVREHACELAEAYAAHSPELRSILLRLAGDTDARVRFRCALALGGIEDEAVVPALARIAISGAADRWVRAAVLSSVGRRPTPFLNELLHTDPGTPESMAELLNDLGQIIGSSQPPESIVQALNSLLELSSARALSWQVSGIKGLCEGMRRTGKPAGDRSVLMHLVSENTALRTAVMDLLQKCLQTISDEHVAIAHRAEAVGLLGYSDYDFAAAVLRQFLAPQQPVDLQLAAVRALGMMQGPSIGEVLVERDTWQSYTPPVREAVLSILLSEVRFLRPLFDAIEAGYVQTWSIDPGRRAQLLQHGDEKIRERAAGLFQETSKGDRQAVFEEYKALLELKADAKKGRTAFANFCGQCHRLGEIGSAVGPDLTGIRNQTPETLLLHILIPNHEMAPGFTNYIIETNDDETFTGIIASETPTSVTLRRAQGEEHTILRSQMRSMRSMQLSLMPEEIEKNMSKQDLADLIAFLREER